MGMGYYNGYQQPAAPMQKFNNVLTAEQIKKLQQNADFQIGLSEEEIWRGICNHRTAEGDKDAIIYDPATGVARCAICGYQWRPIQDNESVDSIQEAVDRIVDILQTIKILYLDLPAQAAKDYFPIIPLIEKIPKLYEFAAKNFNKHEVYNWQYNNANMNGIQQLQNLNNLFASGMYQYQAQPQGMYQQPFQAQPQMTPQFSTPQFGAVQPNPATYTPQFNAAAPGVNPFGYPGAQPNPAAYTANPYCGFAPQPTAATAPVTPTEDAGKDATVKKEVTV
jgi:hypothetical protein